MIKRILATLAALFCVSAFADGPYYFSNCDTGADAACVAGSDANNGTASATPWQTLSKLQTTIDGTTSGRDIRLAKGARWNTASGINLSVCTGTKCSATNPLSITGYVPSWGSSTKWIMQKTGGGNGALIDFQDGGTSEEDHGYVVKDGHLIGSGTGGNQQGMNFYNDPNYISFDNMEIEAFDIGVNVGNSNAITGGDPGDGFTQYLTFVNGYIHGNTTQGWLGGCSNCLIGYTTFTDNGFGTAADVLQFNHNIYVSSLGGATNSVGATRNMRVIGNTLTRSAVCKSSTPNGSGGTTCSGLGKLDMCDGVPLVVHGQHKGLLIENNTIDESLGATGGCYGIQVGPGYGSEAEYFNDVVVRGNKLINVGGNGIAFGGCAYCTIEGNEIIWTSAGSSNKTGIVNPDGSFSSGDQTDTNLLVRNNTVYINGTSASNVGIQVNPSGSGLGQRVVSNLVVFGSSSVSGVSCYKADATTANYSTWDYNYCYSAGATPNLNGATQTTMSAWTSAGFDTHGTCCATDPKVDTPSSGNSYSVKPNNSASPLRNAGHASLSKRNGIRGEVNPDTTFVGANPYSPTIVAPNAPAIQ